MLSNKLTFSLASLVMLFAVALLLPTPIEAALTWSPTTALNLNAFAQGQSLTRALPIATSDKDGVNQEDISYTISPALVRGLRLAVVATYPTLVGVIEEARKKTTYTLTASAPGETDVKITFEMTHHAGTKFPKNPWAKLVADRPEITMPAGSDDPDIIYQVGQSVNIPLPTAVNEDGDTTTYSTDPSPVLTGVSLVMLGTTPTLIGAASASNSGVTVVYKAEDGGDNGADTDDELSFSFIVETNAVPTFPSTAITNLSVYVGKEILEHPLLTATDANTKDKLMYSFTPDLPAGIMFNERIKFLYGTPTTPMAETEYTYTATDPRGNKAEKKFKITVMDRPAAPAGVMVTGGLDKVTVAWTRVANTMYEYTKDGGATWMDAPAAPAATLDITTMTSIAVQLRVKATDTVPAGYPSTAMTVPAAPKNVMAKAGNGMITVEWDLGDLQASQYQYTIDAGKTWTPVRVHPLIVQGANGTAITVHVRVGTNGLFSRPATATPTDMPPNAPMFASGAAISAMMGTVNMAFTSSALPMATVAGGGAITYTLTPALPAGLTFNSSTRMISGTPTVAMAMTAYTYTATANGRTATLMFNLTVGQTPPNAPMFASGAAISAMMGTVNMAFTSSALPMATVAGGGAITYTLTPALPAGLTFNSSTRMISGTPTVAMAMTAYTYTATANGRTATLMFNLTVGQTPPNAPMFASGAAISAMMGTVNMAFTSSALPMATVAGGGAITYTLTPALPAGLTFNSSTRMISGTPTVAMAMTAYTYTATANGRTATLMFNLTVAGTTGPVIPSKGFGVLVHPGAMASDTGIDSSVKPIPVSNMADLMDFFLNGGTIIVKGPAGAAVGDLKITEIMAAKDATLGSRSKYSQWIEVYNKTGAAITFDGSRWMLDFKQGSVPEPAGVSSSAAGRVDLISNMGNPGFWAIPSKGGRSEATTAANAENLVSMYRKLKQFDTANTGHADHAKDDGDPERSGTWVASGRPTRNLGGNRLGTPGTYPTAAPAAKTVPSQQVLINEIGNSSSNANDWVELKNISGSEQNLRKWELTLVMSVDGSPKETQLVSFPDNDNVKLAADGILLISNSDPTASGNDLAAGVAINKAAADRVKRGVQSMYYIDSNLVLPNSGKYNLILRNANDKEGKSTNVVDHGGTYFAEKKDGSFDTEVWPLQLWAAGHGNVIDGADEDFRSGLVYKRNGKNTGIGDKHWAKVGFTGIGYDRTAAKTDENGGTPGYDNGALKEKVADLSDAEVAISEIMFSAGSGRRSLPQWIELYNSSLTQGVNLNGWQLEIQNARHENLDARQNATITLGAVTLAPNQTVLIVSTGGSNSGRDHFPDTRTIDLWTSHRTALDMEERTDTVLSPTGFYLKLTDKDKKLVDEVGNTDGNRRTNDAPEWALPMGINSDGHRASIIRRYEGDMAEDGMMQSGWISAENTGRSAQGYSETTYYGDRNDVGTPGHHGGGPLPVSLASFRPARDTATGEVVIRWTTESELNNAGFNILRSETKTGEFTVVNGKGIIPGHGTTAEKHAYTWTDTSAKPNVVYYYQIEDVSLDGTRTTLRTTHLRGNVNAAGKLTTTWGDLKTRN